MLRLILVCAIAFFSSAGISRAEMISLDLLAQGCPTEWHFDTPQWQTDFDLGVTFSEISHVYVDWSGEFTASLIEELHSHATQPNDVGFRAWFSNPRRSTEIFGGAENYPNSVTFNYHSEIVLDHSENWADIYDGKGMFSIQYIDSFIWQIYGFVEHGSITLNSATLVVDGVVVPEPMSFVTLAIGAIVLAMGFIGKAIRERRA